MSIATKRSYTESLLDKCGGNAISLGPCYGQSFAPAKPGVNRDLLAREQRRSVMSGRANTCVDASARLIQLQGKFVF